MTKFEKKILNAAYENYSKNRNSRTKIRGSNAEEIMQYINAARSLVDKELITVRSDNLYLDSFSPFDAEIVYELTDLGLQVIQE